MNNKKSTKRALTSSILSLVLCMAMLIGTTFAWFTDNASTAVNTIQSGKLDVVLEYSEDDGATWADAEGKTLNFMAADGREEILWEPGCTYELPLIRVRNNGNLALKYKIGINGVSGDAKLLEVIDWTATVGGEGQELSALQGELLPEGESAAITLSGHMMEEAGNEYQDLAINGISITVFATQLTSEYDSISNLYDKMATVDDLEELNDALAGDYDLITLGADIALSETITIPADKTVAFDLAGYTMSYVVTEQITANSSAILNKGDLTILDSVGTGKLSYNFDGTVAKQWAYAVAAISNNQGTLTVKSGTIESLSLSTNSNGEKTYVYKFTIDNLTNGSNGDATLNIEGGKVTALKGGSVRGFANSTVNTCYIDITGGEFVGQVWLQNPSSKANLGDMTISGGYFKYNSADVAVVEVDNGMTASITGGVYQHDPSAYVADGYSVVNNGNGTWSVVMGTLVSSSDELSTALSAGESVYLSEGEYTMSSVSGDVTISGTEDAVVNIGSVAVNNITFDGVTVASSGNYYTGITTGNNVVYNNCVIENVQFLYAENVEFNNCTFAFETVNDYVWTYGANNVTFTDCTFNTMGKAILVFQDGSSDDVTVKVEGCTFNASQAAYTWNGTHVSAVSIDGSQGGTYDVILNNNIVDSDFNGLWQDKTSAGNITVTVDGATVLKANN